VSCDVLMPPCTADNIQVCCHVLTCIDFEVQSNTRQLSAKHTRRGTGYEGVQDTLKNLLPSTLGMAGH
jgi:hypothetical protein